jgi:2-oxoisovalerate dehydrogenase E1 component
MPDVESLRRLHDLLLIRAGDSREERLLRQGKGWFHIPCLGHEALAVIAEVLEPDDLLFLYYRDRALMQARGVTSLEMARDQFATARSSSGGRVMPLHGSYRRLGIFPAIGPTGAQCLPAVGAAWGIKLLGAPRVVICTIGDAATRQGEFFEAVAFAVQEALPIVFVVEDNGFGISTPTERHLPFRLGIFADRLFKRIDGRSVQSVLVASREAVASARRNDGPQILWIELDRLESHTHSDDHRIYRTASEIAAMKNRDPIEGYIGALVSAGEVTEAQVQELRQEVTTKVEAAYLTAESEAGPDPVDAGSHTLGPARKNGYAIPFSLSQSSKTMVGALNTCLREALDRMPNAILFGEDIEDPKGGVFGFTKGLSTRHPGRVINSPLAEATIVGTAVGLAATGFRPIFEIQFIDYAAPAFNQFVNQLATLRWRSNGDWTCPAVFYAPYGAYLPAGGTWHSQSNEGFWTHIPGLRVAVPSTPQDLIGILWSALQETDPSLILIPKHIMRVRHDITQPRPIGFGQAHIARTGTDVSIVAWGNCLELAHRVAAELTTVCAIEIIDLVSLIPCDWETIDESIAKTGRLVVVCEDARTGSFGQAIITEMVSSQERFNRLLSPPILVARDNVHIAFNPNLEYATLPDVAKIRSAVFDVLR